MSDNIQIRYLKENGCNYVAVKYNGDFYLAIVKIKCRDEKRASFIWQGPTPNNVIQMVDNAKNDIMAMF
jgi:hypothetical protein